MRPEELIIEFWWNVEYSVLSWKFEVWWGKRKKVKTAIVVKDTIDFSERECVVYRKGDKERKAYFDANTKIHLINYRHWVMYGEISRVLKKSYDEIGWIHPRRSNILSI